MYTGTQIHSTIQPYGAWKKKEKIQSTYSWRMCFRLNGRRRKRSKKRNWGRQRIITTWMKLNKWYPTRWWWHTFSMFVQIFSLLSCSRLDIQNPEVINIFAVKCSTLDSVARDTRCFGGLVILPTKNFFFFSLFKLRFFFSGRSYSILYV